MAMMNGCMRAMPRKVLLWALAAMLQAQSTEPMPRPGMPPPYIQNFADKLLSALNGREQEAIPVKLPLALATVNPEKDELTCAMANTYVFRDDTGKFWFVTDERNREGNSFRSVLVSSEDWFRLVDPVNRFKHWDEYVRVEGEGAFNFLTATIPGYYQMPLDSTKGWLEALAGESLYMECNYAVHGSLKGRAFELRLPSKTAFFLDASDRYVLSITFTTQGHPEQVIYYPDPARRPKLERPPLRPSPTDGSKLVSLSVKTTIWKAIQETKAGLGLNAGKKVATPVKHPPKRKAKEAAAHDSGGHL